jgi:UTP--glucose-1-phosphate uridylyltransferase
VPINAAVIPVAGLGTRLLPATRSQPKEMLPLVDKPVVQYVVEELAAAGIERILFVTGRRKRAIEDHFDHDPELEQTAPGHGLELLYTRQSRPAGLGDALRHATGFVGEQPVVVALGDSLIQPPPAGGDGGVLGRLMQAFEHSGACAAVAVAEVPAELVSRYGIAVPAGPEVAGTGPEVAGTGPEVAGTGPEVAGAWFEASAIVEKPDPSAVASRWAVMARYVLAPSVFAALAEVGPDGSGEVQLASALELLLARGERVVAVPLTGGERRQDIGTVESYCSAFLEHALSDPRFGPALRERARALLDACD